MRLSKRETYIAAAAIAAVALLALDRYVVTPVLESGEALEAEKEQLVDELANAQRLFERRQMLGGRWDELTAGGLTDDPEEAESLILHAMRDWAAEAGLSMSSLKPERDESDGKVREITIAVAGTGPMRAVARFLWQAETSPLPLRIHEVQLGARREGADDLSLQVRASTLYLEEGAAAAAENAADEQGVAS